MEPLHDSYDGLTPTAQVNIADVAAIAGVEFDTAQRWARRTDFPPGTDDCWPVAAVLGWLCTTGRLEGCAEIAGTPAPSILTYDEVSAMTGLSKQSIKVYRWKHEFPDPDGPRIGKTPTWKVETITGWLENRVDGRRKTEETIGG